MKAGSRVVRTAWMSVHRQAAQTAALMAWCWVPTRADLRAELWAVQRAAPKVDQKVEWWVVSMAELWVGGWADQRAVPRVDE